MTDSVARYHAEIRRIKRSASELQALTMRAYGEPPDLAARREIVEVMLWLPFDIAIRAGRRPTARLDAEDLIQVANMALMTAVDSWEPTRGAKLATWIRWAVTRDIRRAEATAGVVQYVSYDTTESMDDAMHEDENSDVATSVELWENERSLWNKVAALDPMERDVLVGLYLKGDSLRTIASNMKISHTQVANLRDSGLAALRSS